MSAAVVNLSCYKGEAVVFPLTHVTSAFVATAIDITGWTIKVTVRDGASGSPIWTKTCAIVSGVGGTYTLTLVAADTLTLVSRSYPLDIWRTDSGSEKLLGLGTFAVMGETRNL